MITIRPSEARGHANHGWLDSKHTFSFADYHDPKHMGFSDLRVINEDIVAPGSGFPTHPHRDMEIITYVLSGELAHKDSLGNGSTIKPGDVQRMSAGTGIAHSEFNPSQDTPVHLLQIWILPKEKGIKPSYAQEDFTSKRRPGRFRLLVSHDGHNESLSMNQDAELFVLDLDPGQSFTHKPRPGRVEWVQMAKGEATINGQLLKQGDGAAIEGEEALEFSAQKTAEILVFDLAP
jgi:redox-sensitive bicupin YhaK (pirin superfamily)